LSGANLLDVNVLLALFWPSHAGHELAHRWHTRKSAAGWATCGLTQAGFVRLIANPAVTLGEVSPAMALERLKVNCARPGHVFWPMNLDFPEALELSGVKLEGHNQVTDIYLIGLAVKHKGHLVTFDKALGKLSKSVVVLG